MNYHLSWSTHEKSIILGTSFICLETKPQQHTLQVNSLLFRREIGNLCDAYLNPKLTTSPISSNDFSGFIGVTLESAATNISPLLSQGDTHELSTVCLIVSILSIWSYILVSSSLICSLTMNQFQLQHHHYLSTLCIRNFAASIWIEMHLYIVCQTEVHTVTS